MAANNLTPKIGELIIGIDSGTTQCSVAHAVRHYGKDGSSDVVSLFLDWPGTYNTSRRDPSTDLYYEKGNSVPYTGNQLTMMVHGNGAADINRHIRLWKLMFHHHQGHKTIKARQALISKQLRFLGKSKEDLIHDWVSIVVQQVMDVLPTKYGDINQFDITFVATVPPGRTIMAHSEFRQALLIKDKITSAHLYLDSEPAALFRAWVNDGHNGQDWAVGKTYLVVDGGGGTCDFVRFRVSQLAPLAFTQEYASESTNYASETITDSFEELAASKLPADMPNRQLELRRLRAEFNETCKPFFLVNHKEERIFLNKDSRAWEAEKLEFTRDEIRACFEACITGRGALIEAFRRHVNNGSPLDYLVLGGGLFASPYVYERIKSTFRHLQIRQPSTEKGHVARGSVLSRLQDDFISKFPISRTIAVQTWLLVSPDIRKSAWYKHLVLNSSGGDGKEYFRGATYLVKQGDVLFEAKDILSEATIKEAREIQFKMTDDSTVSHDEVIYTFNHKPGDEMWAALRKDGTWMTETGIPFDHPQYELAETLTWEPFTAGTGITLEDLDRGRGANGKFFRRLMYTIQLRPKEEETIVWLKLWTSNKMKRRGVSQESFDLIPITRKPLFTSEHLSTSLAESYDIPDGAEPSGGGAAAAAEDVPAAVNLRERGVYASKEEVLDERGGSEVATPESRKSRKSKAANAVKIEESSSGEDYNPVRKRARVSGKKSPVVPGGTSGGKNRNARMQRFME